MIPFLKMNGLGNDFAVVDLRDGTRPPTARRIRALADRAGGIGFDQFIMIAPPTGGGHATMRIVNADGGEVESCGNAARCVAALLLEETAAPTVRIDSAGGPMVGWRDGEGIAIDMGVPRFAAADIPLAADAGDPQHLVFDEAPELGPAATVNVGNPHAVFFVPDADAVPLETFGPLLEHHRMFPERANISAATVEAPDAVRVRVWERGVGLTRACGTAACAVAAVGARLGRLADTVRVRLPGGALTVALGGGRIVMTGPYSLDWAGVITPQGFERRDLPTRSA